MLIAVWCASMILAMMFAMGRFRNPALWLLAAMATGPLAPLMLLFLSSGIDPASTMQAEAMELCDACLEPVRIDRTVCRYCGALS
jgi:hypothetical protein